MQNDTLDYLREKVTRNASRIKKLGDWPEWIDESSSLISRVPTHDLNAAGFDAGIACALGLIPAINQFLSARLHANYSPDAIAQVQKEIAIIDPDGLRLDPNQIQLSEAYFFEYKDIINEFSATETCWWLCACFFCEEGGVDPAGFIKQINDFRLNSGPRDRVANALRAWKKMSRSYKLVDDVAVAIEDGGMQAAYVHGHLLAIQPMHGIWFVGTFLPSLNLPDDFEWGTSADENNRPLSGPVNGSKQFVKCATFVELNKVLECAKESLTWSAVADLFQKTCDTSDRMCTKLEELNKTLAGEQGDATGTE